MLYLTWWYIQKEVVPQEFQTFAWELLRKLEQGVVLDWTDIRIYVIIVVATLIGSILGSYITTYIRKRGENAAILKDLDQITRTQEEIKISISKKAWINQNWWSLKRDTYWKPLVFHTLCCVMKQFQ